MEATGETSAVACEGENGLSNLFSLCTSTEVDTKATGQDLDVGDLIMAYGATG